LQGNRVNAAILLLALFMAASTGCASFPGKKLTDYKAGKILVLPPRNAVQNGGPHPRGEESGQILLDYLSNAMNRTSFTVARTAKPAFTNARIATKEEALQEARQLQTAYCLQLVLGEFLDAAPMTFRPDHVTLDQGVMYETATGNEVWRLDKPAYYQKGNPGSFTPLLGEMAKKISKSITAGR
jgi:hypothetical protein